MSNDDVMAEIHKLAMRVLFDSANTGAQPSERLMAIPFGLGASFGRMTKTGQELLERGGEREAECILKLVQSAIAAGFAAGRKA